MNSFCFDDYIFEPSPIEITRHNWCIARCVKGDEVSILHFCDSESYRDGLLIDDLWWENAVDSKYNEIEDIYLIAEGLSIQEDYELDNQYAFFCNANKITKRFIHIENVNVPNRDFLLEKCNKYISSYSESKLSPLLSIITTVYNNAVLLEQTIQSVINQKSNRIEYVIKDACSTDNFEDVVNKYSGYGIRVVRCKDGGIYDGMDQGFRKAKGQYIQILNSDDVFYDSSVADKYIKEIELKDADVFCSNIIICHDNGSKQIRDADLTKLRYRSCINHTSLVMKYYDYCRIGGFDRKMKIVADCDLTIKIVKAGLKIKHLPLICVAFRKGGASSSVSWQQLKEGLVCRYRYSAFNIPGYLYTIFIFIRKFFSARSSG